MDMKKLLGSFMIALAIVAPVAVGCAAMPREPLVLPQVGATYDASYDAVWGATLKSLGVVKVPVADKAAGRIESEPFPFFFTVSPSQAGNSQVIWVSMRVSLIRAAADRTEVRVVPVIHDAFLAGFTPGPTNNPWADLFARIRSNLGVRG